MHSVNGELSTFTDILIWIKEQVSQKQPPWSFFQMSERMAVMVPGGLPAKVVDFIVLMQKNRVYCATAGSIGSMQRDCIFGKKGHPLFPNGEAHRKQAQIVTPSGRLEKRSASYTQLWSLGASTRMESWEKRSRLETCVQNESSSRCAGGGCQELRERAEIRKCG